MLHYDFEESVGWWVTRTSLAYHRALNDELSPHGVTFRQTQVLGWLAMDGTMSQVELAAKMQIEPPTLVGILDRMERDGWIVRRVSATDRRKKMIDVGPRAEPVWERIVACGRRVRARATEGMSPEEIADLKRLLGVVHANVTREVDASLNIMDSAASEPLPPRPQAG